MTSVYSTNTDEERDVNITKKSAKNKTKKRMFNTIYDLFTRKGNPSKVSITNEIVPHAPLAENIDELPFNKIGGKRRKSIRRFRKRRRSRKHKRINKHV